MNTIQTKICPFCGEDIKISAIKCCYCGSMLNTNTIPINPAQSGKTETYLSPGMRLGDYEIVRLIGEGGMGVVYETIYYGLGEPVKRAIKTVPDVINKDPRSLRRLQKEVLIATSLSHPNIVRVYGLEEYQDIHFITMEYIEGYDFREYLDKQGGKISVEETVKVLKGVAEALDYAHGLEKPIIHRDLKPQNLIYDIQRKQLKIVDFGIAAEITDSVTTLTQTKLGSSGSPRYMCYEQFIGEEPAIHMDSYAFGIIVYEALNGEPPFVRGDLCLQHKEKEVPEIYNIDNSKMEILKGFLTKKSTSRYKVIEQKLKSLTNIKNIDSQGEIDYQEVFNELLITLENSENMMNKETYAKLKTKLLEENIDIIKKYAETNDLEAKVLLGECLYSGIGICEDRIEALKHITYAAEFDHREAQYILGMINLGGDDAVGIEKDLNLALKWFEKAAKHEHSDSQLMLGKILDRGENRSNALYWYTKAESNGNQEAKYHVEKLESQGYRCYISPKRVLFK